MPTAGFGQIPGATLHEQLKSLERLHGVEVRGLERIQDEPARPTAGNLRGQVMSLLRNYSYVVLQSGEDGVRGVRILASHSRGGPQVRPGALPPPAAPAAAPAKPGIDGQAVYASLLGFGGHEYEMNLAIDRGASGIVLPAAMKAVLGFDGVELLDGTTRTGRGVLAAEVGTIPAVRIGGVVAENVDVAFVADDAAGGRSLLGESVLKNFNVTYDTESAQLILLPR